MLDGTTLSPGMTVSTALYAVLIPVVGWLVKNGISTMAKFNRIESKVTDNCKAIEHLEGETAKSDGRLGKVEEAIQVFRESSQRKDEQFATITMKLDKIPELTTMMQFLTASAASIVPRPEVDARLRAIEAALEILRERRSA